MPLDVFVGSVLFICLMGIWLILTSFAWRDDMHRVRSNVRTVSSRFDGRDVWGEWSSGVGEARE